METINSFENKNMSQSKERLLLLEKEGRFVFHGSPISNIEELEPRQAHTIPKGEKELVNDGNPAVAASPYVEIAIFRALIKIGRSAFGSDGEGNLYFEASQKALDAAKTRVAYIYVLAKEDFVPKSGAPMMAMDWRSEKPAKPVEIIEIGYQDLPNQI